MDKELVMDGSRGRWGQGSGMQKAQATSHQRCSDVGLRDRWRRSCRCGQWTPVGHVDDQGAKDIQGLKYKWLGGNDSLAVVGGPLGRLLLLWW